MAPKSIFRNTVFKLLLNICNIIVPILVGPYITRVLDKEVYGTYNAANAAFAIFLSIGSLGLYNYGMREISRVRDNKAAADKLFSELLVISLISNAVVSAVYIAYALLTTAGTITLLYVLFAIQFVGNAVYIEWVNEALENYRFITVKTVIVRALYVAAMFLFVRKGSDLLPYTLILSLTYTVNCLASFFYVSRKIRISFHGLRLLPHLRPLLIVFIIMNVSVLFTQIDKIMLGHFVGEVAVSVYQIPHYIMSMIYSLAVAVAAVSMPRLSNVLHAEGPDAFLRLHRNVSRSFLFLLFPACVGVFGAGQRNHPAVWVLEISGVCPAHCALRHRLYPDCLYLSLRGYIPVYRRVRTHPGPFSSGRRGHQRRSQFSADRSRKIHRRNGHCHPGRRFRDRDGRLRSLYSVPFEGPLPPIGPLYRPLSSVVSDISAPGLAGQTAALGDGRHGRADRRGVCGRLYRHADPAQRPNGSGPARPMQRASRRLLYKK